VQSYASQRDFFESDEEEASIANPTAQTWFLLRNRIDETVYAELSLPAAIGDDGRVEEWIERIILPPISLDPRGGVLQQPSLDSGVIAEKRSTFPCVGAHGSKRREQCSTLPAWHSR